MAAVSPRQPLLPNWLVVSCFSRDMLTVTPMYGATAGTPIDVCLVWDTPNARASFKRENVPKSVRRLRRMRLTEVHLHAEDTPFTCAWSKQRHDGTPRIHATHVLKNAEEAEAWISAVKSKPKRPKRAVATLCIRDGVVSLEFDANKWCGPAGESEAIVVHPADISDLVALDRSAFGWISQPCLCYVGFTAHGRTFELAVWNMCIDDVYFGYYGQSEEQLLALIAGEPVEAKWRIELRQMVHFSIAPGEDGKVCVERK